MVSGAPSDGVPLYRLGKPACGYPKHPLARGKYKVPRDAKLVLRKEAFNAARSRLRGA